MGRPLHPRLGQTVDIKMVAETRVSWTLLLLIALGGWFHATRTLYDGDFLNPSLFFVLCQWLYANACAKGEHCIPYTWDIFHERFGWMLCFWNFSGVPFLYCYQACFLALHKPVIPLPPQIWYSTATVVLLLAYWVWDEAQYQKNQLKMRHRGEVIHRRLFPTFRDLPENPAVIQCK